jgi:hypothetical protein
MAKNAIASPAIHNATSKVSAKPSAARLRSQIGGPRSAAYSGGGTG